MCAPDLSVTITGTLTNSARAVKLGLLLAEVWASTTFSSPKTVVKPTRSNFRGGRKDSTAHSRLPEPEFYLFAGVSSQLAEVEMPSGTGQPHLCQAFVYRLAFPHALSPCSVRRCENS